MQFFITDTAADSLATWAVEIDGRIIGNVTQSAINRTYRVTDAGPYCDLPRGTYASREAAARALASARRNCRAERVDSSGLMQIERDVLDFEAARWHTVTEREGEAVRLGISGASYRQIARRLRLDARAAAYSPEGVASLREQHEATLARTARYRPSTAPLAAAS